MSTDKYDHIFNVVDKPEDYKAHNRRIEIEWTPKFCWWIFPSVEINTSMKEVAFYFLCLSLYFTWRK